MTDQKDSCESCRFFVLREIETPGQCRRYAPRPYVGSLGAVVAPKWPKIDNPSETWCGEYEPGETDR